MSVLIVDDDPAVRLGTRKLLEAEGLRVETAQDGREGLQATMKSEFDLILLDIFMPHMNGLDCIRALMISRPNVPVVLITGNEDSELAHEAMNCGAREIVPKPFTRKTLLRAVQKYLPRPLKSDAPTA